MYVCTGLQVPILCLGKARINTPVAPKTTTTAHQSHNLTLFTKHPFNIYTHKINMYVLKLPGQV